MGVHDALGIRRRAGRVGDERRPPRVGGDRLGQGLRLLQGRERRPPMACPRLRAAAAGADHRHHVDVGQVGGEAVEPGQEVDRAEGVDGDEGPDRRASQDVRHLLGAVEVDDRHHRGADHGHRVEGDRGLEAVGELEGHRVAGADASRLQGAGHPPGPGHDLAQRAGRRSGRGVDDDGQITDRRQVAVEELAQGLVDPEALAPPPLGQSVRQRAGRQVAQRVAHHTTPALLATLIPITGGSGLPEAPRSPASLLGLASGPSPRSTGESVARPSPRGERTLTCYGPAPMTGTDGHGGSWST